MEEINSTDCGEGPQETQGQVLSKRAAKKLRKRQKWIEERPLRKAKKKEKLKRKIQEAKLSDNPKQILGPSRKELKRRKMSSSECKVRVVLDFSFDHLMSNKDICKSIKQLNFCYSKNRRAENPLQLYVTSFNGPSKDEMKRYSGYVNWDVNIHSEDYLSLFKKEELIYLTSDSENVIDKFDEDKVYIIGALVDHNSQKGLCLNIAMEQGIGHGRLPIREHLDIKTRDVLAISHVFEILVNVTSGQSWTDALLSVIPQRKGATAKELSTDDENTHDEDNLRSEPKDSGENT